MNADTPVQTLNEETSLTNQLIDILKQEQSYLVVADIQGLIAVTDEKSRVVSRISALTEQRYRRLAQAGFKAMEGGMRAWLDANPQSEAANQSWTALLKAAQAVKTLNSTNGMLIGKHMTYNQQALNVLQGTRATGFYGPDGQATTKLQRRGVVVG
jgi:flagella synthesis protein FlgN